MSRHRHIPVVVAAALAGAALAVTGGVAFACTNMSTIAIPDPGPYSAGETITGTGSNFDTKPGSSAIQVHFNAMSGSVVWSGMPSAAGSFTFSFVVPNVAVGNYFVGATQTDVHGNLISSSNTRLSFNVAPPVPPPAAGAAPRPRPVIAPVAPRPAGSTRGLTPPRTSTQSAPVGTAQAPAPATVPVVDGSPLPTARASVPAVVQAPVPATAAPNPAIAAVPAPALARGEGIGRAILIAAIALGAVLIALVAVALRRPKRRRHDASPSIAKAAPIVAWAEDVLRDVDAQTRDRRGDGAPVGSTPAAAESTADRELQGSRA